MALEQQAALGSDPDIIPAVIVYERSGGVTDEDIAAVRRTPPSFGGLEELDGEVVGPIPSEDGEAIQLVVPLNVGPDGFETIGPLVDGIRDTVSDGPDGLESWVTGPAGNAADSSEAFEGIDGTLLFAALGVVILILLFTYRSPVLWILPVFSSVVALFVSQAVIYLLAKYADLTVNGQSAGILTVLVIGAGTDYALLLVARYREELRLHGDRHEAMTEAVHRAGPAVLASGGTVVLGMLCLLSADMNSTAGLGPVAAIGVAVTLVVLMTLLPALLVICGRWVFWPVRPRLGSREPSATGIWAHVGALIKPRPRAVWVVTTVLLLIASLGGCGLNATGLSQADSFRGDPESIVGDEVARRALPRDRGQPGLRADHRRGRGRGGRRRGRHRRHQRGRASRRPPATRRWSRPSCPIPPTARPPTTPSNGCAPAWTTSATARRWSVATPRSTSTCRPPRSGTTG